jgi:uncharacterized protein (DUF433 family)
MLVIATQTIPIAIDPDGVARVGQTRVTLDTVIAAFDRGSTAEEIVYQYPALKLSDVYSTISFYLNHQQEVTEYLQQRQQQAREIRLVNEQKFDSQGLRKRLLARQAEKLTC